MSTADLSRPFLAREAQALLMRVAQIRPFSLSMPAVAAAALPPAALRAIEAHLIRERRELHDEVQGFLGWLQGPAGHDASPRERQRRFAMLKMRFNAELDSLDIFADVLNQRSEHETGLWLGGLDAVARDGLTRPGLLPAVPPLVTYLDRGHGAAIRRARTRLPGRGKNPVAVIRVPRERMVGSGIGASLLHEVGHQAAALLDLVASLRGALRQRAAQAGPDRPAWAGDTAPLCSAGPTLAMAVIGQAASDERLSPLAENRLLTLLLRHWALQRGLPRQAVTVCRRQLDPSSRRPSPSPFHIP